MLGFHLVLEAIVDYSSFLVLKTTVSVLPVVPGMYEAVDVGLPSTLDRHELDLNVQSVAVFACSF